MPYKDSKDPNIPDYVPKKYRSLFVSAFNSAYNSFDAGKTNAKSAEEYAFKVANSAVKKAKKKKKESLSFPSGTRFATEKEIEFILPLIENFIRELEKEEMLLDEYTIGSEIVISLAEAQINKESRTADVIAIQSGWSYNGNYYSKPVAESLATHLLSRKKIYLNHVSENEKKLGRDLRDWVATIEEAFGKDGKTQAKISFTTSEAGEFIFQEALKHPDQVQFSIDALARAREGEAEGKKGVVIEKFVFLDSLDVVDYASAGGKLIKAYASKRNSELNSLIEVSNMLKDAVGKKKIRAELDILMNTFINLLYKISWSYEEDNDESKKEQITGLVAEFLDEFNKLDLVTAFESKKRNKEGEEIMEVTLEKLKEENPEILEAYKKELETESNKQELVDKIAILELEVSALKESMTAKDVELVGKQSVLDSKEKELKDIKESLDKYILVETVKAKEDKVKSLLVDSKLGKFEELPDTIRETLLGKEKEEDIKVYIESLESFIATKSVINGAGNTASIEHRNEIKSLSDEDVVNLIKRNYR